MNETARQDALVRRNKIKEYWVEGKSQAYIAGVLGISRTTVSRHIRKIRQEQPLPKRVPKLSKVPWWLVSHTQASFDGQCSYGCDIVIGQDIYSCGHTDDDSSICPDIPVSGWLCSVSCMLLFAQEEPKIEFWVLEYLDGVSYERRDSAAG